MKPLSLLRSTIGKLCKRRKTKQAGKTLLWLATGILLLELLLRAGGSAYVYFAERSNTPPAPDGLDTYRVLCLGESTTANGGEFSWPSQLEGILNERSGDRNFEVINGGIAGINTAFIVARLKRNIEIHGPHLVVSMIGSNDVLNELIYDDTSYGKARRFVGNARLIKLGRLLRTALEEQIIRKPDKTERREAVSEHSMHLSSLGISALDRGDVGEAEALLKRAIRADPNSYNPYTALEFIYREQGRLDEAEEAAKEAIRVDPNREEAYTQLGSLYLLQQRFLDAKKIVLEAIRIRPENEPAYSVLGVIYDELLGDELPEDLHISYSKEERLGLLRDLQALYRRAGVPMRIEPSEDDTACTRHHYNLLYRELTGRGIRLMAMQYPLLDIGELKRMFEGDEDIIFLSNRENFVQALEEGAYEDYFIDRCAGVYGHATAAGNRLIAQNVADAILTGVFVKVDPPSGN